MDMKYMPLSDMDIQVWIETEEGRMTPDVRDGRYVWADVSVSLARENGRIGVYLTADTTPVARVFLRWAACGVPGARILGDAWERGYGDMEWRGVAPDRVMPWYILCHDGDKTNGYGVETGCGAMCSWRLDTHSLTLCADVRCGGAGVALHGRTLHACTVVSRPGEPDETPFMAAKALCHMMCPAPRLPRGPVFGGNNWYYAYGKSSHDDMIRDSRLIARLSDGAGLTPFMVIDDGWQVCHGSGYNGGPWDRGNGLFPDMAALAREMKETGVRPGIWFRPLVTKDALPGECYIQADRGGEEAWTLDPSHPLVLRLVEEDTRRLAGWGFELIKHDYSTFDIFGRWGMFMGGEMTRPGWRFYDHSRTTAEIILELYRAIRRGAGEDTILLGCNTVSHLAAGLFEIMRTGDDTSGVEWERTRKMGVNTLAFRMPQNGAFYLSDADCAGVAGKIDWRLNREWIRLLSVSGTPLFLSVDPAKVTPEQEEEIHRAILTWARTQKEAVPLDWMETTCPETWDTQEGRMTFQFPIE